MDFQKGNGLVPAIVQDVLTLRVLMLGYMNEEALKKTKAEKRVTFFSRTKNRLWTKGETSGNFLDVVHIIEDCDQDTVLIKAKPVGPVCHTGTDTCFDEVNDSALTFLSYLENVIIDTKASPREGSYTTRLFEKGINKIAQKVGEEAVEVVIEAKDNDNEKFKGECADLIYHLLVLLAEKNIRLTEVVDVLKARQK
ncbi:MAG: bifunctional phosphoribosyl-AMP cyclohydrolase/phosphoribosyl-ATP diphosphatase HisIE [Bacteroidota bacterium]